MDGLGGGFRYARVGASLFDEAGRLSEAVGYDDLARLVFFLATGQPWEPEGAKKPLLGVGGGAAGGMAVYLLYNGVLRDEAPQGGNVLTRAVLANLPQPEGEHAGAERVVYGTATTLEERYLEAHGATFRQIPYALGEAATLPA
jgi:hypothetical protein